MRTDTSQFLPRDVLHKRGQTPFQGLGGKGGEESEEEKGKGEGSWAPPVKISAHSLVSYKHSL